MEDVVPSSAAEPGVSTRDVTTRDSRPERPPLPIAWVRGSPVSRRAGSFYVGSWRRYLARRHNSEVPVVRPHARARRAHVPSTRSCSPGSGCCAPAPTDWRSRGANRETIAALEMYEAAGWLDDPNGSSHGHLRCRSRRRGRHRTRRLRYERLSFESEFEPHPGEPGRERWLAYVANRRARASMLRHEAPRPWIVCVHGAEMGRPYVDLALFRARWLHEALGLNVIVPRSSVAWAEAS